ncbi:MAG: alpha/beta fold hydrolase [Myxococcota bacterium]|nr:alpha/beta fold hydrolase [Myxococcota bacterium]
MPEIKRPDGTRIHYEARGEGPPLLLTHGYAATSRMWQTQLESLSKNRKVIAWDIRGHGRSVCPADPAAYSLEACMGDMIALLDHVEAPLAVAGGLSLGGYISLAFRLAHPERVRGLVLVDTGPGFRQDAAREGWNRGIAKVVGRLESQGLDYLDGLGAETSAAEHGSVEGLILAAQGILTQDDARVIDSLPEIDIPTLVVVGENDRPYLAASDYMAQKIAGARKAVIPEAGHAVNLHQPDRFDREILAFLEAISA